jgi:phospholipase D1/2
MGWSDISCSLEGVVVQDLMKHFTDRWNFIHDEKYNVRKDARYSRLSMFATRPTSSYGPNQTSSGYNQAAPQINVPDSQQPGSHLGQYPVPPGSQPYAPPPWQSTSRPHTPSYENQQPQPAGYQPPQSTYTAQQPASYPPPPPGGPPQLSPQPQYPQQSTTQEYAGGPPHISPQPQYAHQTTQEYAGGPPHISPQPQYAPQTTQEYAGGPPHISPQPQYAPQTTQEYAGAQYVPPQSNASELGTYQPGAPQVARGFDEDSNPAYYAQDYQSDRGLHGRIDQYRNDGHHLSSELRNIGNQLGGQLQNRVQNVQGNFLGGSDRYGRPLSQLRGGNVSCQIVRSCTLWSNGTQEEHSVQNAYIDIIRKSQHFVYIENQFFITKSNDYTSFGNPVKNQIGRAIVNRVLQAARAGEQYKVIVLIPSVPGFAGDLQEDSSLGTRAIMELQYDSICRGGNSIFDLIAKVGTPKREHISLLRRMSRTIAAPSLTEYKHMPESQLQSRFNYRGLPERADM